MDTGNETRRFVVTQRANGRYAVRDLLNGRDLRFSFSNPPLYGTATQPADEWDNYYAARGFCQRMAARSEGTAL